MFHFALLAAQYRIAGPNTKIKFVQKKTGHTDLGSSQASIKRSLCDDCRVFGVSIRTVYQ
jgi:hypothetical protein